MQMRHDITPDLTATRVPAGMCCALRVSNTINPSKYRVSCADGKISVSIKIAITFIFRFHRRPIQLFVFVPISLSWFLHHRQVLLGSKFLLTPGLNSWSLEFRLLRCHRRTERPNAETSPLSL